MISPILVEIGRLAKGEELSLAKKKELATHLRYIYDDWTRMQGEVITLREKVRLLRNENEFLTGLLQED